MTKKNNKIAKELKDRRYHQRVVKNKKAYRSFLRKNRMKKANKKRNPIAKQLRHFKQKVIKNKKAYDRKKHKMDS